MGENCPFMALQRVHEKSRSAPEMKLTCPVSGFHSAKLTTEFAATSHISSKAEQEPSTAFDSPKFVRNFCLGSIQEHADGEDESESTFPGKGCSLRNPASYETSDSDSKEQQKESHLQSQASFSTEKFPKLGYSGTARSNSHAGSFAGIEVMMKGSRLYRSKSFSQKMFNGFIAFISDAALRTNLLKENLWMRAEGQCIRSSIIARILAPLTCRFAGNPVFPQLAGSCFLASCMKTCALRHQHTMRLW